MPKVKTQAEAKAKTATPPVTELRKATPDKPLGPQRLARVPMIGPYGTDGMADGTGGDNGGARRAGTMHRLQRTLGNSRAYRMTATPAVSSTVPANPSTQMKFTVGQPGDMYEREADAAASRISAGQPVGRISRLSTGGLSQPMSQRLKKEEAIQRRLEEEHNGMEALPTTIQAKCRECEEEEKAQRREGSDKSSGNKIDTTKVERAMARSGAGSPLSPTFQTRMEESFGADFSGVRVHTGAPAHEAAQALNARAFTHGSSIYLGRGEAPTDRGLMAHELTHTVQQKSVPVASMPSIMRQPRTDFESLFGPPPDLLGGSSYRQWFDLPPRDVDVLRFTHRFFPSNEVPLTCPKRACHAPPPSRPWRAPPDRRVTERRLLAWARDVGTEMLLSDASLIALQLAPGSYSEQVREMRSSLIKNVLASHEFQGTTKARQGAAAVLAARWGEVGPILDSHLRTWFQQKFMAALQRTPAESTFITRPTEYAKLLVPVYLDTITFYRALGASHHVRVGSRWGDRFIVGALKYSAIWFHLAGEPYFFYRTSIEAFNRWDPVLTEVSRQVVERTRFAAEVLPLLMQVAGFTLGLSARLGFVIAGIALEELGEEMKRDVRGKKQRSLSEILTSAGKSLLIDRVLNRVFGGSAGAVEGGAAKATAKERAAVAAIEAPAERAVKRELADTEAPKVANALRAGDARPVKDPRLLNEGYIVEVKIVSEGQEHVYRQLADGTWCRFSKRICNLDLGADVKKAARSATEVQLEAVHETLEQIKRDIDVLGSVHDRLRALGRRGRERIDPNKLTTTERELLDEISPSGDAADLTLAELARLRRTYSRKLGSEYRAALDAEARLIERLRDEARPLYDKMRAASPREAQRRRVLRASRGLDAASRASPGPGGLAVDHVVPLREIVDMKGFKDLHFDDQLAIVNDIKNLRAIDAAANSSRGDRAWSAWPQADKYYDRAALARMRKLEDELRAYLERQIRWRLARRRR